MRNCKMTVEGNTLTITVDLSADCGPSKSGKTRIIASTDGNHGVAPGIKLGLNVYRDGAGSAPAQERGL